MARSPAVTHKLNLQVCKSAFNIFLKEPLTEENTDPMELAAAFVILVAVTSRSDTDARHLVY